MLFRSILLTVLFVFTAQTNAQQPPGPGPGGPGAMPGAPKIMFKQGGIGTLGSMSRDLPSVGIAYLPMDHLQVGLSLGLTYDGNGLLIDPSSSPITGARMPATWRSNLLIAVEYMVHDSFPFAMGPQFAVMTNLAPGSVFDMVLLNPAWGFWYAPFNAPVGIGSSLGVNIVLSKFAEPVVSLSTPAVRLVYVFN